MQDSTSCDVKIFRSFVIGPVNLIQRASRNTERNGRTFAFHRISIAAVEVERLTALLLSP